MSELRALWKRIVSGIPGVGRLRHKWFYFRHNVRDVYDSYITRSIAPVMTPLGFKFGGSTSQHHRAMQQGTFEAGEVRLLTKLLPAANVFIDVGANAGYFTCLARAAGRPGANARSCTACR